jgi:hypothetical protein
MKAVNGPVEVSAGQRVRVDMFWARCSLPKDRWGLLSQEGVRLTRVLERVMDETGSRPFVTEVRDDDVEIATSFYGDAMTCIRVPRTATKVALMEQRKELT